MPNLSEPARSAHRPPRVLLAGRAVGLQGARPVDAVKYKHGPQLAVAVMLGAGSLARRPALARSRTATFGRRRPARATPSASVRPSAAVLRADGRGAEPAACRSRAPGTRRRS